MTAFPTAHRHAASRDMRTPESLLHWARMLVRSLESVAARHGGHEEVVAVCRKWAHRVSELERQAISAGLGNPRMADGQCALSTTHP